jgi:hypothetical protein
MMMMMIIMVVVVVVWCGGCDENNNVLKAEIYFVSIQTTSYWKFLQRECKQ